MAESSRPVLLPQNRKIRHLQGIFVRNLTFDRPQGRTTDDSAVKHSPGKIESLRETSQLQHSASSENLRPGTARRRSTNLGNATPFTRQRHLEASIDKRVANAFFSLHVQGEEEDPVYISETAERSTNFDFRFFELSRSVDSTVLRSPRVTVKIWAQRSEKWSLHLEEQVDLRRLNFLGSMVGTHFPPNCLVFHLTDGIYTLELPPKTFPPRQGTVELTSSYNALMRLSTLEHSIQDALAAQNMLKQQISDLVSGHSDGQLELNKAEDGLKLSSKYVAAEQRSVKNAIEQIEHLNASITDRRDMMDQGRSAMDKTDQDMKNALLKLSDDKEQCQKTRDEIRGQRRRICEDLNNIFKIEPVPDGKPLQFQIRGIHLPNAEDYGAGLLSGAQEDELSAALGHVTLLTKHLEMYLSVPLPYPVTYCGSRSYITDDISILKDPTRDFPLYIPRSGSAAQFRFDYGWFILNKNIETLCTAQGLKVMDIRHTLPNLKYLLFVCSAGTDELPERKKGGVRGLQAGIMRSRGVSLADDVGSLTSSRRGSVDSDMPIGGGLGGDDLRRKMNELGIKTAKSSDDGGDRSPDVSEVGLPFHEGFGKMTLRTKGMREHVGK
ncbi:hypothetical protein M406DRAFT_42333 [Cryphonectria parasitica EP155]|uniref:Autophagy-related protein 14 n=1 Tax=Cryphonectria parasitica (strain ATCC 38755 / EP155) TaxID=660469 RepID=A0A9P4Y062_CRYP1|nr:uncharacterized protein M406DRAFT_42333 [Cryphonectria parasitica EP155]KAF3764108.1 hypothetical protein M406DRAFT_42333 [Cryphonectria parasitica EP155]